MSANLEPHESPAALRKTQVRVLDDLWLLTLFALLLATGVPWFVSVSVTFARFCVFQIAVGENAASSKDTANR